MTIRTPTRTTPVRPQRGAPDALVLRRGEIAPGRARAAAPLRREGPAKLTGEAKYADDLVFPGAWFGATIRSTDAHARFVAIELDPRSSGRRRRSSRRPTSRATTSSACISDDQPMLVPVGGEIQHHAEPLALIARRDRETLREASAG